jgi:hypothetical protein
MIKPPEFDDLNIVLMVNHGDALVAVGKTADRNPVAEVAARGVGVTVEVAQKLCLDSIGIDLIDSVTNKPKGIRPIDTVVHFANRCQVIPLCENH